jgi:hypothetical protein
MAWEMMINNENKRVLIKARMEVNIKKKRMVRFTNFIMIKNLKSFDKCKI